MKDFLPYIGQLGTGGLFALAMVYMVLRYLKERKTSCSTSAKPTECKAPDVSGMSDQIDAIYDIVTREDEDGAKLIFIRQRALEAAITRLADNADASTKLLTKIYEETRDTRREIERLDSDVRTKP